MRKLFFLLLLVLCATLRAQPPVTIIKDTLYNLDGSLTNGDILITNPAFITGGFSIAAGTKTVPVRNGAVDIALTPTDNAVAVTLYTVATISNMITSTACWAVPTTTALQTIAQVTASAGCGGGGGGGAGGGGGGSSDPCSQIVTAIPSGLHCVTVSATAAQLLNNATPFLLVAAAGAGNVIFPLAIRWKYTFVSQPYQEPSFGGPLVWWQNNANAFNTVAFRDSLGYAANEGVLRFPGLTSTAAYYAAFQAVGGGDCGEPADPAAYTNQPLVLQPYPGTTLDRGPVLTAAVNGPGTGYIAGAQVTSSGPGDDVLLTVSSVNGSGGVTGLTLTSPGIQTAAQTGAAMGNIDNAVAATVTPGHGGHNYSNGDTGLVSTCASGTAVYTVLTSAAGVVETVSVSGGSMYAGLNCGTTVTTGGGDGTLQLIPITGVNGSGLTVDFSVLPGDGSLTVTIWYLIAPE